MALFLCRRYGSDPLKAEVLGGLPPKNKTPQKIYDAFLDAKFKVDHDFAVKLGLAYGITKLWTFEDEGSKGPKRSYTLKNQ